MDQKVHNEAETLTSLPLTYISSPSFSAFLFSIETVGEMTA